MSTITNERMESFIETITKQTRELLHERADDMLQAWHENIEEATENEAKFPPLKVGVSATVDIEAAKIETVISFSVKYQSKASEAIEDPNQAKLPGMDNLVITLAKKGVKVSLVK